MTRPGAPLYAPYPLSVAIPAMMAAHLTVAGAAEAIITAGLAAYLQRANPELLEIAAPATGGWRMTRPFWAGLGALMALTPLGLLAAGTAWGEWGVEDFQKPEMREQIAQASGNITPPEQVPQGLARLAGIWTAPMPDYAPAFMHNASFGYIVSAVVGVGLIILVFSLISWIAGRNSAARRSVA